jgi:hypothetical protein
MTEPVIPAPVVPATPDPAAPAEKSYTEAEHKAAVEAAVQARFKNAPTKEQIAELTAKAAKADELEAAQLDEIGKAKLAAEKSAAEAASAKAELEAARVENLRLKVGNEKGLPAELIARLNGATEEEIAADADVLLAVVPKADIGTSTTPPGASGDSLDARYVDALKRGDSAALIQIEMQRAGVV